MIAPDFVTRGVASPADDTLATLCDRAAKHGYEIHIERRGSKWQASLHRHPLNAPCFLYSCSATPAAALRLVLAKLPQEAPHA